RAPRPVPRHLGAGRLRPRHGLGPRVGHAAAVPDHVHHPQVDVGRPAQAERERAVLGRVDHGGRARVRRGGRVDTGVLVGVVGHPCAEVARQMPARQPGDVPGALHLPAQRNDPVERGAVPAAERALADGAPEVAGGERPAARAPLVVADAALPQVDHLAERADAGQPAEHAFQQGGTAATETAEVDDARHYLPFTRSVRITSDLGRWRLKWTLNSPEWASTRWPRRRRSPGSGRAWRAARAAGSSPRTSTFSARRRPSTRPTRRWSWP